jgi:hypothetical protein
MPVLSEGAFQGVDRPVADSNFAELHHEIERRRDFRVPAVQLHGQMPVAAGCPKVSRKPGFGKHRLEIKQVLRGETAGHRLIS